MKKKGIVALVAGIVLGGIGAYTLSKKPKYIETPVNADEDYDYETLEENCESEE